jgi:hypothetical protein
MSRSIKQACGFFFLVIIIVAGSCKKKEYKLGDIIAPSDITINTTIVGQDGSHPDGDGSGNVLIEVNSSNTIAYSIDYDASDGVDPVYMPTGRVNKKYTKVGINKYTITVVAYGAGGEVNATATKDIQVRSDFVLDPEIEKDLTGDDSKTWRVDKSVAGHFGVGPWSTTSVTPEWWSAGVNEKVACCNCFYTSTFTFTKVSADSYTLTVASPDGAFTKTGALAGGLPGIPASGDEACYSGYSGGTSAFSFGPATSGIAESTPSTLTSIYVSGTNTFIGYGALLKEYEILTISETEMYLRVQGTETGNAWYLKLKAD